MIYGSWNEVSPKLWLNRTDVIDKIFKEELVRKATQEGYKIIGEPIIDERVLYYKYTDSGRILCEPDNKYAVCEVIVRAEVE